MGKKVLPEVFFQKLQKVSKAMKININLFFLKKAKK
jgi:hypothetical protein